MCCKRLFERKEFAAENIFEIKTCACKKEKYGKLSNKRVGRHDSLKKVTRCQLGSKAKAAHLRAAFFSGKDFPSDKAACNKMLITIFSYMRGRLHDLTFLPNFCSEKWSSFCSFGRKVVYFFVVVNKRRNV